MGRKNVAIPLSSVERLVDALFEYSRHDIMCSIDDACSCDVRSYTFRNGNPICTSCRKKKKCSCGLLDDQDFAIKLLESAR